MRSLDIKNVSILVARIDHTSVKLLSNELFHRLVALLLLVCEMVLGRAIFDV